MVLVLQLSGDRERLRGKLRHELRHLQRKFEPSSWRQALSGAVAVAEGRRVYHVKEVELSCVVCLSVRPFELSGTLRLNIKVGSDFCIFITGIYLEFFNHEKCDVVASSFDAGIS